MKPGGIGKEPAPSSALHLRIQELEEELTATKEAIEQARVGAKPDGETELKDMKTKLRVMTTKFATLRKERDALKKDNLQLEKELITLQSTMREMVPGLQNTSSTFPMLNELGQLTDQFYKCDCQDFFFEVLSPELSLEGVVYFFQSQFRKTKEMVGRYFEDAESQLKAVSSLDSLEGPIMNVLRKSYQVRWKSLYERVKQSSSLSKAISEVQSILQLGGNQPAVLQSMERFTDKMGELQFCYYIADPPVTCLCESVGDQVEFNGLLHEPIDGFLRPGDPCVVVLPATYKNCGELLNKASVLHIDYQVSS